MTVLLCGGAGYIGSHVNKELSAHGIETVVFDNLVYGHREAVQWGQFFRGDLSRESDIEDVFSRYRIDAVMHFAAYAYVGESMENPEKYYLNNVAATLNLLKTMRAHNCLRIIFSSTCATYGIPARVPITEELPQRPVNPYGASKLMVERIFRDYHQAYGLGFEALRYFNAAGADPDGAIGESHHPETHLIPLTLDAAAGKRENIQVFGTDYDTPDGTCVRDYIHVTDLARAHCLALEYLMDGGESCFFNLGNERGASVNEVIASVKKVTGRTFPVIHKPRRPGDPAVLVANSEKIRRTLGWEAMYPEIDEIVRHAWNWHQNAAF